MSTMKLKIFKGSDSEPQKNAREFFHASVTKLLPVYVYNAFQKQTKNI